MNTKYIIKNGKLIKKEDASISIYNKAYFFDFVVYSNIKIIQGKMFIPELEIDKLFESAKILGLKHGLKKDNIIKWTRNLIKSNKLCDALIRILLIGPEQGSEPILFLFPVGLTFYPGHFYKKGAKLVTYRGERYIPTAKTKNLLLGYIAYRGAVKHKAIDAILIDKENNIREGTRSSFFVIQGDTLIIPPKDKTLEGVTKKIILDIASNVMNIQEKNIPLRDIAKYDEYFISGTTLNIMPINGIDDIVLGGGVGEKVKKLQSLYKSYCANKFI